MFFILLYIAVCEGVSFGVCNPNETGVLYILVRGCIIYIGKAFISVGGIFIQSSVILFYVCRQILRAILILIPMLAVCKKEDLTEAQQLLGICREYIGKGVYYIYIGKGV